MATYHRVYDSRHLQSDCQGPWSALEPYARQSSMRSTCSFVNWRRNNGIPAESHVSPRRRCRSRGGTCGCAARFAMLVVHTVRPTPPPARPRFHRVLPRPLLLLYLPPHPPHFPPLHLPLRRHLRPWFLVPRSRDCLCYKRLLSAAAAALVHCVDVNNARDIRRDAIRDAVSRALRSRHASA